MENHYTVIGVNGENDRNVASPITGRLKGAMRQLRRGAAFVLALIAVVVFALSSQVAHAACKGVTVATQPISTSVCPGTTATFTVAPNSSATAPISYQWRKNGVAIPGATTSIYTIASAGAADVASYTVVLSNTCPSTDTSSVATLTLNTVTAATALSDQTVCETKSASFTTTASGTGPFTYSWTRNGTALGSTSNTLSIVAAAPTDAGTYTVIVTGACNSVTNSAVLTVNPQTSATGLTSLAVCPGQPATFSTVASGTGPFTYVWKKNGTVQSSTSNSLSIASVSATDAGTYTVEVTGSCTSVTNSATLTLNTVTTATALSDQTVCETKSFSFTTTASGTGPFTYAWALNGSPLSSTSNTLSDVSAALTDAGTYTVIVTGACNSVTNSAVLTVNPQTSATSLTSLVICPGQPATFSTVASGTGPFTYVWKKNGIVQSSTSSSLSIASASSTDAGTYAVEVTGACTSVTNSATLTVNTATSATALSNQSVCETKSFSFTTTASGTGPFTYAWTLNGNPLSSTSNTLSDASAALTDAGTYTVIVTGTCNSVTNSAVLTVNPVTSATALTSQAACPGQPFSFSTVASGTGPFTYVWKKDGVTQASTSNTLSIASVVTTSAGTYTVIVNGACTSVTNTATLTVNTNTSATALTSQTLCPGQTATFTTVASGTGPFTYVWKKDGVIQGSTSNSLSVTSVSSADAGTYTVTVTGTCTSVTNSATLTVNALTTASALTSLTNCPGTSATFSTTAGGTGPFTYVWKKDGVTQPSTSNTLSIASVAAANAGTYTVIVTGNCNSVTNSATLTVNPVTTATALTGLTVCPGDPAVFSTTASGTGPFTYVWKKNGTVQSSTSNSLSIASASSTDGGTYTVEVTGACTKVTNSATLTVNTATAATPLSNQTVCETKSFSFTTTASGTGPFTYSWTFNGTPLGSTSNTLTDASAALTDAGTYTVIVTGTCNSVTNSAVLTVNPQTSATPLTSQAACPGQPFSFSTVASGTGPYTYVWKKDGVTQPSTSNTLSIASVVTTSAGTYTVIVNGACTSVTNTATLTVNTNTSATALTSQTLCPGQTATFTTVASGTGPFTYLWRKDGVIQGSTSNSLSVASVSSADAGTYTVIVSGTCTSVTNSATLTVNTNTSATALTSLAVCPGAPASFSTIASGTGPFTYVWKKDGVTQPSTSNTLSIASVAAANAGTYTVIVTGNCNSVTNSATLTVNPVTAATALTGLTVCPGDPAVFSTAASGTGPFTYVWKKNGTVQSSTSNSLSIASASSTDAGTYTVEVTGACTKLTNSATLTVNTVTAATALSNQTVCETKSFSFTTTASGTGPFTYAWFLNGTPLGSTSNTLTDASAALTDAGTYTVVVSGNCNSVTNSAVVTVNPVTSATSLTSLTVCPGQSATFSTAASGTGPFTYVWKKNGTVQSSTSNSLSIASASSTDAGTYTVEVTGGCTSVTNSATLTVNTTIATALTSQTLCPGQTATFTTVASGTGPFTYVWKKDGVIQASTSNSLSVASVSSADAGTYTVTVSGPCTSVTNSATLTLNTPTTATALTSLALCAGSPASFSTIASGTGPFTYVWKKDGVTQPSTSNTLSIASLATTNAGTYTVIVAGSCNSVTNSATLTVNPATTATALTNTTVTYLGSTNFTTTASGTGPFTYVWKKDGVVVGSTSNVLNIVSAQTTDAGTYTVEVTGACGSVTNSATLTVNVPSVPGSYTLQGESFGSSVWDAHNISGWAELQCIPTRVDITGGPATNVTIQLTFPHDNGGAPPTPGIQDLYNFTFTTNIVVVSQPILTVNTGSTWTYSLTITVTNSAEAIVSFCTRLAAGSQNYPGSSLHITGTVLGGGSLGPLQISKPAAGPGTPDLGIVKTGPAFINAGSFVTYTLSYTNSTNSTAGGVQIIDYLPTDAVFVSCSGGCTGSTNNSTIVWDLGLLTNGAVGSVSYTMFVSSNVLNGLKITNTVTINTADNDSNTANNSSTLISVITNGCVGATIGAQPLSTPACAGSPVTLSVGANGTSGFVYQWFKNGSPISGATQGDYTIASASAADVASYFVTVTNGCGSITSSVAVITLNNVTTASALTNLAVCPNNAAVFSTTASGTGPFAYQWSKNGGNIIGATNSSYTISSATVADVGTYSVIVTGTCNSVTNSATLSINTLASSTGLTSITNNCSGTTATFIEDVSGSGPFVFVWKKNGTIISGQTTSALVIASTVTSDSGTYTVEVTGPCNSITNTANLVVSTGTFGTALTSLTNCPGTSASWSTVASGAGPFTYQWRKNGGNIAGATDTAYAIASVTSADSGTYSVLIQGNCNTITNSATLTVNVPITASGPSDTTTCASQNAILTTSVSGSGPVSYLWKKNGFSVGNTTSTLNIGSAAATDAGTYTVEITGPCNTITNTAVLTVNSLTTATALSNQTVCPGEAATFSTAASGSGTLTYVWKKNGVVQGSTTSSLTIASATSGDAGTYTVEVTGTCNSVTNSATLTVNTPTTASALTSVTNCAGQSATFSTIAAGTGTFTYVWKKDGVLQSSTSNTLAIASIAQADAGTYTVEVTGTCNSVTNSATLTVNSATTASALTDTTVCAGQSVSFTTVASGTGPFTYVWKKNGTNLGNNSDSLTIGAAALADAGTYTVEVYGTCSSVTNSAVLTVNAPTAATALIDQTKCPGDSVTFSTAASGTGPFTYVWKKDGVVQGSTSASLTIASVSSADAGTYTVEVAGTCGVVTNSATLTVNTPTTISPISNLILCPGQAATFNTTATGTGPFTYVWKKNGVVQSSTSDTLTIASVSSSDAGTYAVEVTGNCNSVTNFATLTVNDVTSATALTSQIKCPGDSVTFSTAASGTGPFSYTWKKDGAIQASTTDTLTIASVSSADAGTYTVEVTGSCTIVTNSATLTVNDPTTASALTDVVRCSGKSATFTTVASGTGPFNYVWKKDGVVQSSTSNSLSIAAVSASDAGAYTVEVTGTCNSVTNGATLTVNELTTASALIDIVTCGQSATFTTIASGTGPFTYVWKKNGIVQSSTTNFLTVPSVASADAGTYTVEVTGACNSVTNSATLTLNADTTATSLDNLIRCPGQSATFSTVASGSGPFTYVWKKDGVVQSSTSNSLTIDSITSSDAGTYTIEISGACNSVTNSATLTVNTPTTASPLNSLVVCPGRTASFSTIASGTGPFTYVWKKDGIVQSSTSNELTVASAAANDGGIYTVEVGGACNIVTNSATLTVNENTAATSLTDLVLCPGQPAGFAITVSGTGPFAFVWKKDGVVLDGETTNSLSIGSVSATNAGTYTVEVTGTCNAVTNSATLTVNENVASTALTDVVVCENQSASFSTTTSGTGPISYVWKKDGSVLSGETTSSLSIASAQIGDAGVYTVEVSGLCTSVTNSATLTVNRLTTATDLASLVRCPGSSATFSTVASGTGPFSYVWSKDGQVISGETTDHLTINNIVAADGGTYSVHVAGTCNAVDKSATLTVNENTAATALSSLVLCPGQPASFNTVASGTGPFSYVWKKDGVTQTNTTDTLSITSVTSADAGTYTVEVTGTCNAVTNSATLTVNENVASTALTDVVVCENQSASFSTTTTGTGPISYVWKKDGSVLSGETTSSLSIASAQIGDAGVYTVEVSGLCTSVTNSATLTVNRLTTATDLASLVRCPGSSATFSTVASGTGPFSYVWSKDGQVISGETTDHLTINNIVAANGGTYSVHVAGTCNAVDKSATLTVNEDTAATTMTNLVLCPTETATFTTTVSGTGPFAFVWKKDGAVINGETTNSLTITNVTSANAGTYTVEVTGTCTSVTNNATLTVNEVVASTALIDAVVCEGQPAGFSTVTSGTGPFTYVWKKDGNILSTETQSSLSTAAATIADAGVYTVEVTGLCTSVTNSATLTVNRTTTSSDLTSLIVCPSGSATFTTVPSGTGPFTFVWTKDGQVLASETADHITLNSVSATDAGTYNVHVTGTCNSVDKSATLTVNENVSASSLSSLVRCPGQSATFSTAATGTGPISYVWKKDGVVQSSTSNSLTVDAVASSDAGTYTVEVFGACTSVTNSATLTVNENTSATLLSSIVRCPGETATFTTVASGTGPFTYVWRKDGVVQSSTSNSISVASVTSADAGTYIVEVMGTCTSVTNSATLTVNENTSATSLTNLVLCPGDTAAFSTIASGTGPFTYVWKKDGVLLNGETTNSITIASVAAANAGTYTVEVTGTCTSVTNTATLTVNEVVSSSALSDVTVCQGQPAGFSTTTSGTGPFTYVWKKDGNVLSGETQNSISIAAADLANAGTYTVEVTGLCTSVTNSATLTVNRTTTASALTSLVVCPTRVATFTTVPSGTGPFSFVWSKDGQVISGETDAHITLNNVTAANAGTYSVHVTGTCNSVDQSATLTVNEDVSATALTNMVLCPTQPATFATTATGTGPLAYVWKKDGSVINGETTNTLTVASVSAADAGTYTVEITGVCTSVTNSATLTVNENVSSSALVDLVVCQGQPASFNTVPAGTGPFSYVWKLNGNVLATETQNALSIASADLVNAGTYTVEVSGLCTSVTNSATLTVNRTTTATDLSSLTQCPGTTASFTTVASGTGPFTYVWSKDGQVIATETTDHLTLNNITAANAGTYTVHVSGTCNSVDKSATLAVNENTTATSLTNLVRCPGMSATFATTVSGTGPFSYVWKKNGVVIANETTNILNLTSVVATNAGTYTVEVSGLCISVTNTATLTVNEDVSATALTDVVVCEGQPASFATAATGTGPITYVWKKDGNVVNGETGSSISIGSAQVSDGGVYTVEVTGACTSATNSASLTVNRTTTSSSLTNLSLCPGQDATFATVPSGTGPFTFVWTKNGQVMGGQTTDHITVNRVTSADAGTYAVHVTGTCNSVDVSATLTVNTNASATALTSLVLCPAQPATFTTIASGTGPLTFIWKKDGVVQSSTSNSLTVASVTSADAGTYTVEVYGICTSATNSATLTVNSNTTATALANLVRCPGDSAVFSTVASGTGPFSYVWRKNGNVLTGETNNSLTISSITSANAGLYSVEVSGTCTIVTNSASLTVNTNVSATALSDAIVCPGSTTTFSTVASGTGPFGYVWKKNGNIIGGQTTSALTLSQVTTNDSATYTIEVSGTCSAVTNSATLLVSTLATTPLNNLVGCQNQPITFATTVMANSPATYVWKKNGNVIAGATTNTYTINSAQTTDAGTYSVEVTSACLSATNTATLTMNTPTTASALIGQTRCPGQSAAYSTVASGSGPFTYVWKQNGQVLPGQTGSSITLASLVNSNSGTYTVEVSGSCNTVTNSATLTVKTNVSTSALGDLVVCSGQPAVFTTTASGTAPFSYRWRKNGVVISGATTSSYTIASTSAANAGSYSVEVTGSCNTATNFGTLNISTAPVISGLADQNICIGDTATFAITVTGTGPFTYQWRFNGNIVAGQTTNTLVLPNLPVSANVVTVEVSGPCTGTTNSANLTVWNNIAPSNGVLHVTNSDAIRINDNQPATPYPSTIFVRCVPSQLKKITVTLNAISHNYPSDIDVMLVSPAGRALVVMSHCGGDTPANGATITIDDDAPATLSPDSFLADGTFKVSSYWTSPYFPTPAPTPNAIALRDLVTDDPSGSWSLYVLDDEPLDDGYIADGWTLNLYYANLNPLKFINSTYLADGTFQTTLIGTEGITHTIQSSTDLIHWTTVTNSTLPGGSCTITVPTAANGRMQYYRAFRTE